jgi:hypothetical protein
MPVPKNTARHGPDTRAGRVVLAHVLGPRPKHDTGCCYSGVPAQVARRAACSLKFLEHRDNHISDWTSFQSIYTGSNHQKFRIQDQAYEHTTIQATRNQIRSSDRNGPRLPEYKPPALGHQPPGTSRHQNSRVPEYQMSKQNYSLIEIDKSQTDTNPLWGYELF